MPIEILAPAGGMEQLIAAVRSGADAVYLGTALFNARRNAANFDGDSLKEAVSYCHGRGVGVHVTLNTLVRDAELPALYGEIEKIAASGADAVIVADLAAAELFKRHCPSMPLHASTQMTIHNLEGVLAAQELGFTRVVLARELSIDEINLICEKSDIETEVFVHGALCMCMSGQCYLSSFFGGRSGNRGLCAQPCRLDFKSGKRGHALSLKDMCHIPYIRELENAGVRSLKIEGRMKRPEYVSAAVLACREALSGSDPDLKKLRAVFSRSGFTDGYYTGKRGPEMFGYRTKEDAAASAAVLGDLSAAYRNELARVGVDMRLHAAQNEPALLEVTDGTHNISIRSDMPELAVNRGKGRDIARESLSKTGGTPFFPRALTVDIDDALIIPPGQLNAMRRTALSQLLEARSRIKGREFSGRFIPPAPVRREIKPELRARLSNAGQLFDSLDGVEKIYIPLERIDADLLSRFSDRLICELPRLIFPGREEALEKKLYELRGLGLKRVCAGNIGALRLARRMGFIVHGGFGLNIQNSESLKKYESSGLTDTVLSIEINLLDASALGASLPRGIIGYGYLPLMVFRNCPAKTQSGCNSNSCNSNSCNAILKDRAGIPFRLMCGDREFSELYNSVPLWLGDKNVRKTDFTVLYFTFEDRSQCESVWERYRNGEPFKGDFTRGLYYKKLP